ncbi:ATP-binding cassette domain-containing protein [Gordonia sp. (in: high G+C Gram-positive bacteria)]|uniref:ABC transporter ATP-binding protein n=1 Tax=Gordonia sp. (in: high G+C Gram-positive bacteria) TaxID=84139 RepID=UPI0016A511DA|nr:ATP-binding cassette domain-containing protein [Gordonia sp. (in: high G+C Gram-positive bacteria)]NLG44966.1 ATP-binding cassette domain-containing protein [Gordonia sp. (in: high G+C Gram-positive bacteria)]
MIEIDDLRIDLGKRTILREVNLSVAPGEIVYLLGRNGAGKSTLLRAACGMVPCRSGEIRIDGAPLHHTSSPARNIGMHLGIDPVHAGHTGRRQLRWIATAAGVGRDRVEDAIELTGIGGFVDRRVGSYSLGMRQRLGIACALLPEAQNLVFDEPLNGLDVEGIIWFRKLLECLAADGRAVLLASHLLSEVQRSADRIAVIDDATLTVDLPTDEVVATYGDLERGYLALIGAEAATAAGDEFAAREGALS